MVDRLRSSALPNFPQVSRTKLSSTSTSANATDWVSWPMPSPCIQVLWASCGREHGCHRGRRSAHNSLWEECDHHHRWEKHESDKRSPGHKFPSRCGERTGHPYISRLMNLVTDYADCHRL